MSIVKCSISVGSTHSLLPPIYCPGSLVTPDKIISAISPRNSPIPHLHFSYPYLLMYYLSHGPKATLFIVVARVSFKAEVGSYTLVQTRATTTMPGNVATSRKTYFCLILHCLLCARLMCGFQFLWNLAGGSASPLQNCKAMSALNPVGSTLDEI